MAWTKFACSKNVRFNRAAVAVGLLYVNYLQYVTVQHRNNGEVIIVSTHLHGFLWLAVSTFGGYESADQCLILDIPEIHAHAHVLLNLQLSGWLRALFVRLREQEREADRAVCVFQGLECVFVRISTEN
jgi:hypothetical protein